MGLIYGTFGPESNCAVLCGSITSLTVPNCAEPWLRWTISGAEWSALDPPSSGVANPLKQSCDLILILRPERKEFSKSPLVFSSLYFCCF